MIKVIKIYNIERDDYMHNLLKQKICLYLFMLLMFIFIDCVISSVVFNQFFVKYPLLEIASIMIIIAPLFLFKTNKFSIVYCSVIFGLFIIIMVLCLLLNYASGDIFSIKYLFLFNEAAQVMSMQFVNFWYIVLAVILVAIYVLYVLLIHRLFTHHVIQKTKKKKLIYYPIAYAIMLASICFGCIFKSVGAGQVKKDYKEYEVYKGMSANDIIENSSVILKRGAIKNYGMLTYLAGEITYAIPQSSDSKTTTEFFDKGRIINTASNTDDYSGVCSGKNVITIMIETGIDYYINPTLTPNLYKLKDEGIDFTNNYSKNKTNMSEMIGIVGSIAEVGTTKDYNTKASLANILKEEGYKTSYFHNNSGSFYDRKKIISSMGFENAYFKEDVDPKQIHNFLNANYPLDAYYMNGLKSGSMQNLKNDMDDIDGIIDKIIPEGEKFYSFWTTMSTHGPYNTSNRNMDYYKRLGYYQQIAHAEKNGTWTNICADDNDNIKNQVINMQAEFMDLDLAVGIMLDRLEELGILDDTLIVLYGDHEPYYMSNGEKQLKYAIYNTDDATDPQLYKTTLIMYNRDLNNDYSSNNSGSTEYDKFTSPYVIVPTILDLLGLEYNENHYVGKSAFMIEDELENIFYSHELEAIFSDKVYIDNLKDYRFKSEGVDDTYLERFDKYSINMAQRIKIFDRFYQRKLYKLMK